MDDSPAISAVLPVYASMITTSKQRERGLRMTNATAGTAKKTVQKTDRTVKRAGEGAALAQRYGQIGISAVAAAVRYQGAAKNPAYAPVLARGNRWAEEAA